jgi:hypothetical protein
MSARRIGAALALGVLLALVFDLLLQFALDAVRIQPSSVNWQAAAAGKAVWLLAVSIAAAIAPSLSPLARGQMDWRLAIQTAGVVLICAPIVRTTATLLVFVTQIPLTQPAFYAEIVNTSAPWILAGAVLKLVSRHVVDPNSTDQHRR